MATRRRPILHFVKKPGKYGTLYLFRLVYRDKGDFASPDFTWQTWAYNFEHAEDKFFESTPDDQGWKIVHLEKVRER